jgi:hypothetical protein
LTAQAGVAATLNAAQPDATKALSESLGARRLVVGRSRTKSSARALFEVEDDMKNSATSHLVTAAVGSGVLMAAYLLLRPYGDVQGRNGEVDAMASTLWVVSHIFGMLALASFASLVPRLSDLSEGWIGMVGHWSAMTGLVLVLSPTTGRRPSHSMWSPNTPPPSPARSTWSSRSATNLSRSWRSALACCCWR